MSARMRNIIMILGCVVAVSACKKSDEPKAESARPVEGAPCSPEHTKIEELGFCVKVPKTWEREPNAKEGSVTRVSWFRVGEGGVFEIRVDPEGTMPAEFNGSYPSHTSVTKGELAGGKGKWRLSHDGKSGVAQAMVTGPKGLISWGLSADLKSLEASLDLCKTIVPL